MKRFLHVIAAALSLCVTSAEHGLQLIPSASAAGCAANENLVEPAISFIGRCRKGSITREFPRELLAVPLGVIKHGESAVHKKAWKLLNDNRFAK
ncbi:hypothetical protein [Vitiosangium sp. GDMCC 1.1324]|uniref:hypothetical protein n=1 Tax=Vitiosangium sp. (strain GDMCC 1.1324) TaxID=2138576 RepID=UPI000D3B0CC8|nr:hypothetical protein [Vitiosangium sp. GDMCC 1.1324]PTL83338.1 hypothetical protein DAT35_15260 [Vitiosangium sp. GDMCC 1.1324]